jgi:chemotaxis protein CheD
MTIGGLRGPAAADTTRKAIHVIQGEHHISEDGDVVFVTILGSCVSACIRDPRAGIGGMNHFLLPGPSGGSKPGEAERYAAHLMELLVNALLTAGASRRNLEAKLFGGASTLSGRTDIGAKNSAFAVDFLAREEIPLVGHCLGGPSGRRVQYWPVSGRARRSFIGDTEIAPPMPPTPLSLAACGSLELF